MKLVSNSRYTLTDPKITVRASTRHLALHPSCLKLVFNFIILTGRIVKAIINELVTV